MKIRSCTPAVGVFLGLSLGVLFGQGTTSIRGSVEDPAGAVIAGAEITLLQPETGLSRLTASDEFGSYEFPQIQPGQYRISAKADGLVPLQIDHVVVAVGQPATLTIVFAKVDQLVEVVQVTASSNPLNMTDASLGHGIGERAILQLPFNARNVVNMLSLQPGVTFIGDTDDLREDRRAGNVNGSRSDQSNITLDGVDVNDQQNRFAFTSVLRSTLDSVQEFRVTTLNADASEGRSSGAQVALVTKSGTNETHGSLYEYHRNTATAANDFFNNQSGVARPKLIRNVFGASVGGPLVRNRLFYFLNGEVRRDASEGSAVRRVPSPSLRQGIVRYLRPDGSVAALHPDEIRRNIDPLGIGPSAVSLNIFNTYYPLPNDSTVGDGLNIQGYRFVHPLADDRETYLAKLDYNIDRAGDTRLFLRTQLQSDRSNNAPQFPGRDANRVFLDNSKGVAIGFDTVLSRSLYSSTRYGFTRQGVELTGIQTDHGIEFRGLDTPVGLTNGVTRILPVQTMRQDFAWLRGQHSLRFGGIYRNVQNRQLDAQGSWHQITLNNSWMESSAAELLPADINEGFSVAYRDAMVAVLGIASLGEASYRYDINGDILPVGAPVRRNFAHEELELYVMDSWRPTRSLTVTAGLRWSLMSAVRERNGIQTSPNIPLAEWVGSRALLAEQGRSQAEAGVIEWDLASRTGRGLYQDRKTDFAPRVALAYSPQAVDGFWGKFFGGPGKTVIRAGAGLFYDVFGQSIMNRFASSALGFSTQIANPSGILNASTAPRITGLSGLPPGLIQPAPAGGFPQVQPDSFQITNSIDDSIVPPYSMALNFSVGRDLGHGFFLETGYVGRLSRRTLVQSDLAMPTNLRDPQSGQTYFEAANILANHVLAGTPVDQVGRVPFWENLWPGAAGTGLVSETPGLSATQGVYDLFRVFAPDYTFALNYLDTRCLPSCSRLGPYAMFNAQYASLAAWRSLGAGDYHSGQVTLRKRLSAGVQFDLNYTLGKSIDLASFPENSQNFSGLIINTWAPEQMRAVSEYDMLHQFNAHYVAELPFGRGKHFGSGWGPFLNAALGGWQLSGLYRHTSGLPARVGNGRQWPTNWNIFGFATPVRTIPTETGSFKNAPGLAGDGGPNIFADPAAGFASFAPTRPGQSGIRNPIRGDGFFTTDLGVAKSFPMPWEGHNLQVRWEMYNLTNSTRFDPGLESLDNEVSISLDLTNSGSFGKYSRTLTNPRVMQFALRYTF